MTGKKQKDRDISKKRTPRKELSVEMTPEDAADENTYWMASNRFFLSPEIAASRVVLHADHKTIYGNELDITTLHKCLREQAKAINNGDLSRVIAMLANQSTALQSLFTRLAERAMLNITGDGYISADVFDLYMKTALRAQSQCRSTLEALTEVMQAKQSLAHPQENKNAPNQLFQLLQRLGNKDDKRLDTAATGKTGPDDSPMETVGEIDRTKDSGGQGAVGASRIQRGTKAPSEEGKAAAEGASQRAIGGQEPADKSKVRTLRAIK